ncbi:MAG: hypothetical protein AAF805_03075 [Planctomycetota bacterium]
MSRPVRQRRCLRAPAAGQRSLPLERKDRLGRLAAVDPGLLGVGRRQWARVADLLTQVELTGVRGGCQAHVATLAARMNGGVGVSTATLHRAKRAAIDAGLLRTEPQHDELTGRQRSNAWAVNWDRIGALAGWAEVTGWPEAPRDREPSDAAAAAEPAPQTDRGACRTDTPPCRTDTPIKGTHSTTTRPQGLSTSPSPSTEETRRRNLSGGRVSVPPPDRMEAYRVGRRIGRGRASRRDVELCWKLVAVAHEPSCRLGEAWLGTVIGAVDAVQPTNRWAYAQRVAFDQAAERGVSLGAELRRVAPPPDDWPRVEAAMCRRDAEPVEASP